MLNLVKVEFLKLKRKKIVSMMFLATLLMPMLATIYFGNIDLSDNAMKYFKWTIFSYNLWLILPIILGIFSTMIVSVEYENDTFKTLWIVPIQKMKLLISKFIMMLIFTLVFMSLSILVTLFLGKLIHHIEIDYSLCIYLIRKCFEISGLLSVSMFPILSIAFLTKKYILPICLTIIYAFSGFLILTVNMYVHPLSSTTAIVVRDIPGIVLNQDINIVYSLLCIGGWVVVFTIVIKLLLKRREW
ncbi:ABC transporter permease [Aerococcaceae bacterium zg-ZUI334]|uniref:ABC transporter permease n=1 Tax=Aerococcaceae bacterium zg-252 TaxID=2796928 RepID=UPI001B96E954|nr:ABC transporter permease [Aerococcaceae bacterium zg-ZUI334]